MSPELNSQLVSYGGRLLVGLCLVFALAPPPLPFSRVAPEVTLLLDDSLSTPRDFTTGALRELRQDLPAAPRLIRFAASPVLEAGQPFAAEDGIVPRSVALDGSATDIAAAIQRALHGLAPGRPAALVLASDMAATGGDTDSALAAASAAGVPVYLMMPPANVATARVRLLEVQAPPQVSAGSVVPVTVRLASELGGAVEVVLEVEGAPLERRRLELQPGENRALGFRFEAVQAGLQRFRVRVVEGSADAVVTSPFMDADPPWLVQSQVLNVLGAAPVLYLSGGGGHPPLAASLELAGWDVLSMGAGEFMAHQSSLQRSGTIVLDNVAQSDMGESAWRRLIEAVEDGGKGLAVLGGDRSFGAGAYRHSAVEDILPVTAEAAELQTPAAVMFVLDRSGSMGEGQAGPSRFALARQAVLASLRRLSPGDHAGVVTFAAQAETRLALAPIEKVAQLLPAALDLGPSGGTQLLPAMDAALRQLGESGDKQRLLVLVTDGFAGDLELKPLIDALRRQRVTLIALAVGNEANQDTLRQLTSASGGRLLQVGDSATLPRLMPNEIASERAPGHSGWTRTEQLQPLPFLHARGLAWPPLSGYMVTRAKPSAQLYLQSTIGDPLLATGFAGAGRVAVLPGGLETWAGHWWEWPHLGRFLAGLLLWLGQDDGPADLALAIENLPGQLVFTVEQDREPGVQFQPLLTVRGPSGAGSELPLGLWAPGIYRATLPVTETGEYQASLQTPGGSIRRAVYRNAASEFPDTAVVRARVRGWVERGLLREWAGTGAFSEDWPRDAAGLRQPLLLLALLSYVLVLVFERGLARVLLAYLRARFAR
jgi:uncharacterized protein YegL